jgi:hypothetical protein
MRKGPDEELCVANNDREEFIEGVVFGATAEAQLHTNEPTLVF